MTGNKFLLDTNIIAAWLTGEASVADKIDGAKELHIPIIVIGELYYGALYSTHVQKNMKDIQKIIKYYNVLGIDEETTIVYGKIKAALRKKGKPIPENDIWIAAIAQRYKLTIVTRDKHFKEIDSISLKSW
ncbi:MAG: type II toxin-antitoxin system VapC family toxin [Chitinophagaceae bacterium]|nr:type II toxin-antitoxin system VapC family toxin [Chitinophagaceae bacterium]